MTSYTHRLAIRVDRVPKTLQALIEPWLLGPPMSGHKQSSEGSGEGSPPAPAQRVFVLEPARDRETAAAGTVGRLQVLPTIERLPRFDFAGVLHPTDLTESAESAWVHAVRIALATHAELRVLHVEEPSEDAGLEDFPSLRALLAAWKLIRPDASKAEVLAAGLRSKKVQMRGADPARVIVRYIAAHKPDLVVLATHQRQGLARFFARNVAEPVARDTASLTLFVPRSVAGFVDAATGAVNVQNVVVPVAHEPSAQLAVDCAIALVNSLDCPAVRLTTLFVGEGSDHPRFRLPQVPDRVWEREVRSGDVVESIMAVCAERHADLLVMTTGGHDGLIDRLFGSTAEQVLRQATCPVLAVPAR